LERCGAVLALLDGLDPGTIFEVGYARKLGIPVIALFHGDPGHVLSMLLGSDCEICNDFSTAAYKTAWVAKGL